MKESEVKLKDVHLVDDRTLDRIVQHIDDEEAAARAEVSGRSRGKSNSPWHNRHQKDRKVKTWTPPTAVTAEPVEDWPGVYVRVQKNGSTSYFWVTPTPGGIILPEGSPKRARDKALASRRKR